MWASCPRYDFVLVLNFFFELSTAELFLQSQRSLKIRCLIFLSMKVRIPGTPSRMSASLRAMVWVFCFSLIWSHPHFIIFSKFDKCPRFRNNRIRYYRSFNAFLLCNNHISNIFLFGKLCVNIQNVRSIDFPYFPAPTFSHNQQKVLLKIDDIFFVYSILKKYISCINQ